MNQEHYDIVERFAIKERVLIKDGIRYEIESVNCDSRIIIVYNPITEEDDHFHYDDIDLNTDIFDSPIRSFRVQVVKYHFCEYEVEASNEQEAKDIAEQMDQDYDVEPEGEGWCNKPKDEWIVVEL